MPLNPKNSKFESRKLGKPAPRTSIHFHALTFNFNIIIFPGT